MLALPAERCSLLAAALCEVGVVAFFLVEKLVRWVEEQAGAEDDDAEERQLAEKVAQVKRQREAAAGGGGVRDKTSLRPGEEGEEGEALLGQGKGAEAVEDKGTEAQWDRPTPGQGQAVGASRGEAAEDEGPESEEDEGGWEPLEGPGPELAPVAEAKGAAEGASSKGSGATEGEPAVGTGAAGVAGKDGTGAVRRTAAGVVSSEKRSSHGVTGSTGAGEGASGEGAPKAEASQAQDDAGWRAPGGSVSWSPSSSSVAGYLNLFSDAIHNFTDGLSLGAAFLHRGSLGGYSRMLFMLAHEIPQEVSGPPGGPTPSHLSSSGYGRAVPHPLSHLNSWSWSHGHGCPRALHSTAHGCLLLGRPRERMCLHGTPEHDDYE